jgi:hypothetical protein
MPNAVPDGDLTAGERRTRAIADVLMFRDEDLHRHALAKNYVVSSTLDRVDWNAELVRGDLGKAVRQLKRESGKGFVRVRP